MKIINTPSGYAFAGESSSLNQFPKDFIEELKEADVLDQKEAILFSDLVMKDMSRKNPDRYIAGFCVKIGFDYYVPDSSATI